MTAPPPAVIWPQCCTRRRTDRPITAITAGSVITAITAITAGSAALRLHEAASLALAGGQGNRPPPGAPVATAAAGPDRIQLRWQWRASSGGDERGGAGFGSDGRGGAGSSGAGAPVARPGPWPSRWAGSLIFGVACQDRRGGPGRLYRPGQPSAGLVGRRSRRTADSLGQPEPFRVGPVRASVGIPVAAA